jgi:primosomal protein N' (replication factor Y)
MPDFFAHVILPLSLHDSYTYRVPEKWHSAIKPGQRVVVQFGQKKMYAALVLLVTENKPENIEFKEIQQILDDEPVVNEINLELWKFIATYYCSTLGDVFRVAIPTGLKLESKSEIFSTGAEPEDFLSEKETMILKQVESNHLLLGELQKNLGKDFSYSALKSLLSKNLVMVEEKVDEKYKPKTATFISLHTEVLNEEVLNRKQDQIKKAPKQQSLLYHFLHKTNFFDETRIVEIQQKDLLAGTHFTAVQLNELVKKKLLMKLEKRISRIEFEEAEQVSLNLLNRYQEEALKQIKEAFKKRQVALIHGITASGKTEIYIHLIDEAIKSGRQALYLVPEIALTPQIIKRLKSVFGEKAGIYHSKLDSAERVEIWDKVLKFEYGSGKGYQVILGARSALFLPFTKLGLVVVDEEHENSFKQYDPAPRYNARDMAVMLANQHKAQVLLGSATPSFESYYNALTGKYALVNLVKMHAEVALPQIETADVKQAAKRKKMHAMLTPELYSGITRALENGEQVILFQNRRGYSPFVECFACGEIPKCKNCDVSLTYHKSKNHLVCHYCGFAKRLTEHCESCGSPELKTRGFGTEKIEDEIKSLFKNARIARMDADSTQNKNAFDKIIHNLETRKTDILVGTQMVAKGLDFEHVGLVGILNADNLINFPDFRAHEHAYQLISQVSGRAGRRNKQGKVVIQTSQPEHPLFCIIKNRKYNELIKFQFAEREMFKYPPFYRLIKVVVKHKTTETVDRAAAELAELLRRNKSISVLGPEYPLVSRIKNWYNKEIWLKFDKKQNAVQIKLYLINSIGLTKQMSLNSNCIFNIDVDPQ